MRIIKLSALFFTALTVTIIHSDPAHAQTLGSVMNTLRESMFEDGQNFDMSGILSGFSMIFGIFLGFMGILKLKDHVEMPQQVQVWEPIKRFLAGGSFLALPWVVDAAMRTLSPPTTGLTGTGGGYNTGGVSGTGLDAMLVNLMRDVWGNSQLLLLAFCYCAGVILIMVGISRMLKSEQEGPRGPLGLGTIMTFLIAGVLLSMDSILTAVNNSIFGVSAVLSNAGLAYTGGMSGTEIGHANAVIGAIMAFVAILGMISFVRGFFILRGVSEGSSQASMMAALTHIFGGALAVNLGAVIQATQNTLGITNFGLVF